MENKIKSFDKFVNEQKSLNESAFKRVKKYFKVDEPRDIKITIKEVGKKNYKFADAKIFLVTVDNYKFYFEAFDFSTDTENQLLRSIGTIIDDGRNKKENPDYIKNSWKK